MNKIHHLSTNRINRCLVVWDLMDTLAEVKLPFIGGNLDSNHCKPTNIKKVAKMITDFIWPTKMMIDRANLGQLISVHQGCTDSSASTNAPDGGHAHSSVLLYEGGWFGSHCDFGFFSIPSSTCFWPWCSSVAKAGPIERSCSTRVATQSRTGPSNMVTEDVPTSLCAQIVTFFGSDSPNGQPLTAAVRFKKQTNTLPVCRPHRQLHFSHLDVPARKSTTYNLGYLKRHHKNICIVNYIYSTYQILTHYKQYVYLKSLIKLYIYIMHQNKLCINGI